MDLVELKRVQQRRQAGFNWRALASLAKGLRVPVGELNTLATKTYEQGDEIAAADACLAVLSKTKSILKALDYDNVALRIDPVLGDLEKEIAAARTQAIDDFHGRGRASARASYLRHGIQADARARRAGGTDPANMRPRDVTK